MMHPGKILSAELIHIKGKLLRISPALHKSEGAPVFQTVPVNQLCKLLPHRVSLPPVRVRKGTFHHQLHLLLHVRRRDFGSLRRKITGRLLQWLNGGGQTDPLKRRPAKPVKPCQGKHQMGAPFRVDHRMQFIQNDRLRRAKKPSASRGCEHQVQRFRRGDENVGRTFQHPLPILLRRISRAHGHPDPLRSSKPRKRPLQILPDIRRQRFQGGYIDHLQFIGQRILLRKTHEPVQKDQKGRQCLSRSRGRAHQRMPVRCNERPGFLLHPGGLPHLL